MIYVIRCHTVAIGRVIHACIPFACSSSEPSGNQYRKYHFSHQKRTWHNPLTPYRHILRASVGIHTHKPRADTNQIVVMPPHIQFRSCAPVSLFNVPGCHRRSYEPILFIFSIRVFLCRFSFGCTQFVSRGFRTNSPFDIFYNVCMCAIGPYKTVLNNVYIGSMYPGAKRTRATRYMLHMHAYLNLSHVHHYRERCVKNMTQVASV